MSNVMMLVRVGKSCKKSWTVGDSWEFILRPLSLNFRRLVLGSIETDLTLWIERKSNFKYSTKNFKIKKVIDFTTIQWFYQVRFVFIEVRKEKVVFICEFWTIIANIDPLVPKDISLICLMIRKR